MFLVRRFLSAMEVCAKLESFLEEHELHNIPEIAKRKISEQFTSLNQLISDLKSEKLELTAILERQQFEFEKEISTSQQQLEESSESCVKLKQQIAELEENLNSVQKEWRDLQKLHDSSMLEFQAAKRKNELVNQEKKNLVEQLEKRRADIEKLNGDIKTLLEQATAANEAKFEAIASAEEAKMKESNLQGDTRSESSLSSDEDNEKLKLFQVPFKNSIIALLDHPASITVYHYVSVEVLSGSVSVYGYEIKKGNQPIKVFSSEKTGLIEVKTESFDRIREKKDTSNLENSLVHITDNSEKAKKILEKFGNSTVAVAIHQCILPTNMEYLEFYYPLVIDFNSFKKKWDSPDSLCVPRSKCTPIEFDLEAEKIASEINIFVRSAKLTDGAAPRILVCGPRNTGKSSLLRFLINKILSIYVVAFYLDTDPGQAEFTPPGLVSLTKVTEPIIGPPFSHLKKPVSMIFTGGISADRSPDMYSKSVCKLMNLYNRKFSDEPLFVNTMGWIKGLGLHCLQNVISAVKPTVLIELVNEDKISMFDSNDFLPKDGRYFQLCRSFSSKISTLSSQDMRNISLLSYFGKCQNPFEGPLYLNEIKPYCVSWDKIPVFIFGKKVPPYRMIEAINASIVALCKVPESIILESEIPQFPKTLEDEPDNKCLGYGLVRAVNEKDHLLYIITPLSLNELQKVNAILKGNILVPDAVFLNQPLYNTELPFMNERERDQDLQKMKTCKIADAVNDV